MMNNSQILKSGILYTGDSFDVMEKWWICVVFYYQLMFESTPGLFEASEGLFLL